MTGESLRVKRVLARRTLAEVAEAAGMSASRLCNYENGVHEPSEKSAEKVLLAIRLLAGTPNIIPRGGYELWIKPKGNTGRLKVHRIPPPKNHHRRRVK